MEVRTAGRVLCLLFMCSVVLRVHAAPLEEAAGSNSPLTVKPIQTRGVPEEDNSDKKSSEESTETGILTKANGEEGEDITTTTESGEVPSVRRRRSYLRLERDTDDSDSDSESSNSESGGDSSAQDHRRMRPSHFPEGRTKRSDESEPDCDTHEDVDDDGSTEEAADYPVERRRRRDSDSLSSEKAAVKVVRKRQAPDDSNSQSAEDEDGGFTKEAAIVSPVRRRRNAEGDHESDMMDGEEQSAVKLVRKRQAQDDSSQSDEDRDGGLTNEAAIVSPIRRRRDADDGGEEEDTDEEDSAEDETKDGDDSVTITKLRRRREDGPTTTMATLNGVPLIVVAPSDVPVKDVPQALKQDLKTLQQRIDHFEEKVTAGEPTVPSVGVVAGQNTPKDKDTVIHTLSSAQYIVH